MSGVVSLSSFNADPIFQKLGLGPRDDMARRALRHVYQEVLTTTSRNRPAEERSAQASQTILNTVQTRYETMKAHMGPFFPKKYKTQEDGIILAVLCGRRLPALETDEEARGNKIFGKDNLLAAIAIQSTAAKLKRGERFVTANGIPLLREATFLAYIDTYARWTKINQTIEKCNDNDKKQLRQQLEIDASIISNFGYKDTKLAQAVADLMAKIDVVLPSAPKPVVPQKAAKTGAIIISLADARRTSQPPPP